MATDPIPQPPVEEPPEDAAVFLDLPHKTRTYVVRLDGVTNGWKSILQDVANIHATFQGITIWSIVATLIGWPSSLYEEATEEQVVEAFLRFGGVSYDITVGLPGGTVRHHEFRNNFWPEVELRLLGQTKARRRGVFIRARRTRSPRAARLNQRIPHK